MILFLLIASVPAKAFTLNVNVVNNSVEKGQSIIIDATINTSAYETIPNKLVLKLIGKTNKTCEFTTNGVVLSGCNGMTISTTLSNISTAGYGYGYSYGYGSSNGRISYRIVIDTTNLEVSDYQTILNAYVGSQVFTQTGQTISVNARSSGTYESDAIQLVGRTCSTAFTCTAWTDCVNGKQVRSCTVNPNCYFEHMPEEERGCVEADKITTLKLRSPYETLKVGNLPLYEQKSNNDNSTNLTIILFVLIVLIILLIILILIVVLVKRIQRRNRKIRRAKQLKKIMYKPSK